MLDKILDALPTIFVVVSLAVCLAAVVALRGLVESLVKEHGWIVVPAILIPTAITALGFAWWFDRRAKKPPQ